MTDESMLMAAVIALLLLPYLVIGAVAILVRRHEVLKRRFGSVILFAARSPGPVIEWNELGNEGHNYAQQLMGLSKLVTPSSTGYRLNFGFGLMGVFFLKNSVPAPDDTVAETSGQLVLF